MPSSIAEQLARPALLVLLPALVSAQRTIVVSPGANAITAAVRQAQAGDRIVIRAGLYREPTIVLSKSLSFVGEPGAILDGGAAGDIVRISADDVTVRSLRFRNVSPSHVDDHAAIRADEVSHCRIERNEIDDAFFGIYLAGTTRCVVSRNVLNGRATTEDGTGNGIHLWTAREITIDSNRISGHRDGIYFEFVHNSVIRGNTSEGNLRYGLHFMYSDDCRYEHNTFRQNGAGVAVMYTKRVAMSGNRFEDNRGTASYGLLLKEIYDATLDSNSFARNTTALVADGATRLHADDNVFADNGWAVRLMASTQDAEFSANTFERNTFDVSTNSRSSTSRFAGNYWDEYRGYDLDRDGRGDVAHHPVRLFSLIVERNEPTMILLRSPVVALLDAAERMLPVLTPEVLVDSSPRMRRPR